MSDEARRKERLQERSLAISAIQSNYSDLMKLLITLSSTCLTFTITLLKDNEVGVGVCIAWCAWGICLILTLCAFAASVYTQDMNINLLSDFSITEEELMKRQPSNRLQHWLVVHAFIAFFAAFVSFAISSWPI